ncbi:MAG: glycosyltransferase family 4 protein [Janthinobacterium lividum]
MKVAFISLMKVLPWGGSEELWYKVAKLAVEHGHSVTSITRKWPATPSRITELQQLGVDTKFYFDLTYSIADRISIKLGFKKWQAERVPVVEADIYVISNGSVFDFIYNKQTIQHLLTSGKPYVMISQHNSESGNIVPDFFRNYAIETIQKAKAVFFVAARNMEAAERQLPLRLSNALVTSNPLNIKTISIKPYPQSDQLLMACVARFDCAYKGQDILLQVLSADVWRSRAFHLNLYGAGPHLEYLKQLIVHYKLSNKVSIVGHVDNIDELWENNQVLVLPSLSEGTPLALVEAMLSGRAVVSTDVGGNATYILDRKTGFLADVASVKCIATALENLWQEKERLAEIGVNAYNQALAITDINPDKTVLTFIENIV